MTANEYMKKIKDNLDSVEQNLEQIQCDDCISRQAAQAKIKSICDEYRLSYEDGERKAATGGSAYALGHAFDDIPSVTPKPKIVPIAEIKFDDDMLHEIVEEAVKNIEIEPQTGHWKRISIDKYSEHSKYWYRCDRCGKDNLGNTDWCPNCGAKMVAPQESEG